MDQPRPALALDLTACESAGPTVLSLLYTGSLRRGTADRYSALECIHVFVSIHARTGMLFD